MKLSPAAYRLDPAQNISFAVSP